jgi:hypothetical protein
MKPGDFKFLSVREAGLAAQKDYDAHADLFNRQEWGKLERIFRKSFRVRLDKSGKLLDSPRKIALFWRSLYAGGMRDLKFEVQDVKVVLPAALGPKDDPTKTNVEMWAVEIRMSFRQAKTTQAIDPVVYGLFGHWEDCNSRREGEVIPGF